MYGCVTLTPFECVAVTVVMLLVTSCDTMCECVILQGVWPCVSVTDRCDKFRCAKRYVMPVKLCVMWEYVALFVTPTGVWDSVWHVCGTACVVVGGTTSVSQPVTLSGTVPVWDPVRVCDRV